MVAKFRSRHLFGLVLAALLLATPARAESQAGSVVTAAAQVTNNPDPTRAHSSPQIVRNPKSGELVIAETNVYKGFGINIQVSVDQGRSWFRGGEPMVQPFTWNSDLAINGPYFTMAFDQEGVLYVAFSATDPKFVSLNRSERPRPVFLARSTDGGRSFNTGFVYRVGEGDLKAVNNRRAMLALDPKDASKIYVGWLQTSTGEKSRAMIAGSSDGGRTFNPPVDLAQEEPQGGYQPRPAVGPDGAVHAIYPGAGFTRQAPPGAPAPEMPIRPLFYRRSTDGARTWSPPVQIDPGNAGFFHGRKQVLSADPRSGTLYAVWYGNVKTRPGPQDDTEIFLRASRDGGRTWGDRVTVNDDALSPNVQHYDPGVAVAPDGRVDIAWYDFRNSPVPETIPANFAAPFNNGGFQDVYYAYSTDGGRTFSPNVRISDRLIDRRIGVWSNNIHSHYNVGITSSDDAVYFAWQDSRNGNSLTHSEDVYFASLLRKPGEVAGGDSGSDVPSWVLFGASGAVGMGVAMLVVLLFTRRARTAPAEVMIR